MAPLLPCLALTLLPQTALSSVAPSLPPEERTHVLVLATPHLGTVAGFEPTQLEGLLARLAAFAPDAICIEELPGRSIEWMEALAPDYDAVLEHFAADALAGGRAAQAELSLGAGEARRFLAERQEALAAAAGRDERAAARLDLCLHLLAAYEPASAALQWSLLDEEERAGSGLPAALATRLDRRLQVHDEVSSIALALARRLGHERVHPVDDHADKDEYLALAERLSRELQGSPEVAAVGSAPAFVEEARVRSEALASGDLLPLYRFLNADEFGRKDVEAQWDLFLRTRLPSGDDRRRLGLWDVRNLNIASNVRRVAARRPGSRVLVVIGASHKSFLDALLASSLDVAVVPAADVLGTEDEEPR